MLEIIHKPYGHEHPYTQEPEERFPREPLAGKPVTAGIITRPQGAARAVTVRTEIDGVPGPTVAAIPVADWQYREEGLGAETLAPRTRNDQDLWHATLLHPSTHAHLWVTDAAQPRVHPARRSGSEIAGSRWSRASRADAAC